MVDFPSMSELTSLSHQLARLRQREQEADDEPDEKKGSKSESVKVTE